MHCVSAIASGDLVGDDNPSSPIASLYARPTHRQYLPAALAAKHVQTNRVCAPVRSVPAALNLVGLPENRTVRLCFDARYAGRQ
jgi:hypothetical protein